MASLPPAVWTAVAAIIASVVLGMLHTLAMVLRNEQAVRDLRDEAAEIRRRFLAQRDSVEVVEVVDEAPADEPVPTSLAA